MGKLIYGNGVHIELDDRALAHLQMVFAAKLRRSEAFFFTFKVGELPQSIWLHEAIPIQITFDRAGPIPINRDWLEALTVSASSSRGLTLTPEIVPVKE